jgi:hypothetical protein
LSHNLKSLAVHLEPREVLLLQFWLGDDAPMPGPEGPEGPEGTEFIGWKLETICEQFDMVNKKAASSNLVIADESQQTYALCTCAVCHQE